MSKRKATEPKGLRLIGTDEAALSLTLNDGNAFIATTESGSWFDADQLDRLAKRCAAMAAYLRANPPTPQKPKKWEDL